MRLDAKALRQKRRQFLALEHPSGLLYLLGQDRQRFVAELAEAALVRALRGNTAPGKAPRAGTTPG